MKRDPNTSQNNYQMQVTLPMHAKPASSEKALERPKPLVLKPRPHTLKELLRDVVEPGLRDLQQLRRLELIEAHPLYKAGRELQHKWFLPDETFQNFIALLTGCLDFPTILLLNPGEHDTIPYDEMMKMSRPLHWLQNDVLEPLNLSLHDVNILHTFPMASDHNIEWIDPKIKTQFIQDSFALGLKCLRYMQSKIMISCRSTKHSSEYLWDEIDYEIDADHSSALESSSSVQGPRSAK